MTAKRSDVADRRDRERREKREHRRRKKIERKPAKAMPVRHEQRPAPEARP